MENWVSCLQERGSCGFMDYPNKRNCRSLTSTPIVASERSSVSPISSGRMDNLGRDSDEIATLHDQNGRTQNFGEGEEFRANDEWREGNYTNDRLSDLPNSLLIHILSFLEIRKAAITSVLSKRWRTLWADLPSLEFSVISGNKEETSKLVSMIDRALVIRTVSNLDMLSVCFAYDECFASDVNAWVEFVVMNKVKVVRLLLNPSKAFYTLPQIMFSNSSLTSLSVRGCVMAPQKTIEWPSLTELVIEHVELPQRVVEEILSSCPVLRSLYLSLCWGFSSLKINFPSLCELTVKDFHVEKSGPLLEISAPYLRTLVIDLFPNGRKLQLSNMSSLVSAYIRFPGGASFQGMNNMKKLYEDIRHVEELKLGKRAFKVVSRLVASGWPLPQSRFRNLLVTTSRNEFSFMGLMSLLESSVDLEELIILGTMREEGAITWSPSVRGDLVRDLPHLKTVKISEFADPNGEPLLTTARMLLKRATMLEKIVVSYGTFGVSSISSSNFRRIAQTLSSYPRSSQKLKVIIHH